VTRFIHRSAMSLIALLTTVSSAFAQDGDASPEGSDDGFSIGGALGALEEHALPWATNIVGALVAVFVGWLVAGWLSRKVRKTAEKRSFDTTLSRFFSNVVRYLILTAVVLGVLGVFGIETSSFAAVIGAAGLAIGLAFQGTLGNFASGVMLLVFRPFKVGDFIEAGDETGVVEEIELFTTELKTPDGKRVIVPNGQIWSNTITNYNHYPARRVDIAVGVDYSADIDQVRQILLGCVKDIDGVLVEPAPQAFLSSLGGSSVDWQLRVWVKPEDYWAAWDSGTRAVKMALDEAGIGIPFPQLDVHFDEGALKS